MQSQLHHDPGDSRSVGCTQAAMVNWGKQSAFDMFSNLMTFQALASQQGQAHPAVVPVMPPVGVTLTITVHSFLECSLHFTITPESSANQRDILCGLESYSQLAA